MKLLYGLNKASVSGLSQSHYIKIYFDGKFNITYVNKNFKLYKKKHVIRLTPISVGIPESEILFCYRGWIKIKQCLIDKKSTRVINPYQDYWHEIISSWDDMSLFWEEYVMDFKINTFSKREKARRIY